MEMKPYPMIAAWLVRSGFEASARIEKTSENDQDPGRDFRKPLLHAAGPGTRNNQMHPMPGKIAPSPELQLGL